MNFTQCPKCRYAVDQATPLSQCPDCGLVFAKYLAAHSGESSLSSSHGPRKIGNAETLRSSPPFAETPQRVPSAQWVGRCILFVGIALWGFFIWATEITEIPTIIHFTLLPFHEAGHVIFWPFGEFMHVAGGPLGQWIVPIVCAVALHRHGDNFGAAIATWWLAISIMDVSVYAYDALDPVLPLIGGGTGADSFHDFVYLLNAMGQLRHARGIGRFLHFIGTLLMLASLAWAALLLITQRRNVGHE